MSSDLIGFSAIIFATDARVLTASIINGVGGFLQKRGFDLQALHWW